MLVLFVSFLACQLLNAQEIPLVYNVEHTGANCEAPILPALEVLPVVEPLTDPFLSSDGSKRMTDFADWNCRRNEILEEIQYYEIGEKPGKPDNLTASFTNDTLLTVNITVNEKVLTLTSKVQIPDGEGPFAVNIGIGWGTGSLPPELYLERDIATVAFDFSQVMSHTQTRGEEPINKLYPELEYMGAYSAWSWGVSRLIDGMELVAEDMNIDLNHIGITGCSFAGKMALFAGAFDERIALTIAQESGGGGAAAWRVSETLGNVETLGRTSHAWFIEDMFQFSQDVPKLPFDHHELMALVAPRALLILGNPDYEWLADESGYVSSRAAHQVWKHFGIGDRFGFSIVDGHGHCQLPDEQRPEVEAFIDKFLLGDMTANTNVEVHSFDEVDFERWYEWWGSETPFLKFEDPATKSFQYFELECANLGSEWEIHRDSGASSDLYVSVKEGLNSTEKPNLAAEGAISLEIEVEEEGMYLLYGRINCPNSSDDSFYVKLNGEDYSTFNNTVTEGWEWERLASYELTQGKHNITITYREDGAKLDKLCLTNYSKGPNDELDIEKASNYCH